MTYTKANLAGALDNISGSLPSSLFEEWVDSQNFTIAQAGTKVLVHRCTLSTNVDEYLVFPWAGDVKKIYTVINKACNTANETITFKNGADSLGIITVTHTASAAGDVDSLTPAANASFTAGEFMLIELGGESGLAPQCDIVVWYELT